MAATVADLVADGLLSATTGAGRSSRRRSAARAAQQGRPWNDEMDAELESRWLAGESVTEIAAYFERTPGGIRSRLPRVGCDPENPGCYLPVPPSRRVDLDGVNRAEHGGGPVHSGPARHRGRPVSFTHRSCPDEFRSRRVAPAHGRRRSGPQVRRVDVPRTGGDPAAPRAVAYHRELTARYPELTDVPVEDLGSCPWSCALTVAGDGVVMSLSWSAPDAVVSYVQELAGRHGMVLYDPQDATVYPPSGGAE